MTGAAVAAAAYATAMCGEERSRRTCEDRWAAVYAACVAHAVATYRVMPVTPLSELRRQARELRRSSETKRKVNRKATNERKRKRK